jgi:demethylmenaquinone methyltransferase/2-methoxy-6-polyprenyl-1,4-benzoquinol methylase
VVEDDLERLLAEQVAYYRARAGEYDATYPLDPAAGPDERAELLAALETLAPYGRVLELACGTGQWTSELVRHASAVTAVDASPEALAVCRQRLGGAPAELVEADVFAWHPAQRYDLVFFAAWLSHVPPQRFNAFWELVGDCLTPAGRAFVIDELPAAKALEQPAIAQAAPAVQRDVTGGDRYRAVKVFYPPGELRARLDALGWDADVETVGWRYFFATVRQR